MTRYVIVELSTERDIADDRPLGTSGDFLTGCYSQSDVWEFANESAAEAAAARAPNRRKHCALWITGAKRRQVA